MSTPHGAIYTAAQVRELDRRAIESCGIPGFELMTRAGHALADLVRELWPAAQSVTVIAGPGNNGGDGYVCARVLRARGLEARVLALAAPGSLAGDARRASAEYLAAGGRVAPFTPASIDGEVVVDAIFGIGIGRPVTGAYAAAIDAVNASGRPVLAVDLPSGLDSDTGLRQGTAIRASATLSFIGRKLGCYVGVGPDHAGDRRYSDLDVPMQAYDGVVAAASLLGPQVLRAALPVRERTAHKGRHGHVLIVGGAPGMAGAARLAGEAALRAGAGLVSVATHPAGLGLFAGRPELMVTAVDSPAALAPLLERATVLAVGPGLGLGDWGRAMHAAALAARLPAVIDADALNLLGERPVRREDWVLTPHPGEAARLLGVETRGVQEARLDSARELQRRYGGTIVLKGAGSIVQSAAAPPQICDRGNPGMAAAAMGDVLTGVVAAIAAQCGDLPLAAAAAVYAHATAGDRAAAGGERGMVASDLVAALRSCVNLA